MFPERYIKHVVLVKPTESKRWSTAQAVHLPIRERRIIMINEELEYFSKDQQCERLMHYGHRTVRGIYQNAQSGNLKAPDSLQGRQRPLPEILEDKTAMRIIERASRLTPTVTQKNGEYLTIRY